MVNIHKIYSLLWKLSKFRKKRMKFFFDSMVNNRLCYYKPPIRILDAGGSTYLWENYLHMTNIKISVIICNIRLPNEEEMKVYQKKRDIYSFVQGDVLQMPFHNKSFDICFSNSLIDHLYTFDNQKKFAEEVRRVAKSYFIQTGNRRFFFELHFLTPFIYYLPKKIQKRIIRLQSGDY